MSLPLLWLLQLSDTALPIGALNHSYGLETLAAEEPLDTNGLEAFLHDYLQEVIAFHALSDASRPDWYAAPMNMLDERNHLLEIVMQKCLKALVSSGSSAASVSSPYEWFNAPIGSAVSES